MPFEAVTAVALAAGTLGSCKITSKLGCFVDNASHRVLPGVGFFSTHRPASFKMTQELCAEFCCANGFSGGYSGVEYSFQCFCGKTFDATSAPKSTSCTDACAGNNTQSCGGIDAIVISRASCGGVCRGPPTPPPPPPKPDTSGAFAGCVDANATSLPYCDPSLPVSKRVDDLISRLSLQEKISILSPTASPYCAIHTPRIPRLGFPAYKWLTEVNSDVQSACSTNPKSGVKACATTFIGPVGIGASFNRSSWWLKGDAISTEMRALNNYQGNLGLSGFGPNINLVKDPRYGRNSELPGEDPFLSGSYAVQYLRGMQQYSTGKSPRLKMLAYVKHYTAYNVETSRFTFTANTSQFDFFDSYLPQYKMAFKEGAASGAMCSYFGPNGISVCGNSWLLNGVLRSPAPGWGRRDAVIESDCSAVANMVKNHYANNGTDASAKALNAGMDLYGGWDDDLWGQGKLQEAIDAGLTTSAKVDDAVRRTTTHKMLVGLFDPPLSEDDRAADAERLKRGLPPSDWRTLSLDAVDSDHTRQVAYEMALQGIVLLKNSVWGSGRATTASTVLPLAPGKKIAVVGPFAVDPGLYHSDYETDAIPSRYFVSIADAISGRNSGGTTTQAPGTKSVTQADPSAEKAAAALAAEADVTVLVLGIDHGIEHEGVDRHDTLLPQCQQDLAAAVLTAAGTKPVVLVTISGGILSIDELVEPAAAIIDAFNPTAQGANATADLIFGVENRWGKLPVTVYPANYTKGAVLQDMSFTRGEGRSYRYYTGKALFAFGHGLSYTTFEHTCAPDPAGTNSSVLAFECKILNSGSREGDEVVMVFHRVGSKIREAATHPVPLKRLVEFERVRLNPGDDTTISFAVTFDRLGLTNSDGDYVIYEGAHELVFSTGGKGDVVLPVVVKNTTVQKNLHPGNRF